MMYIPAAVDSERFVAALRRVINAEGVSRERPKAGSTAGSDLHGTNVWWILMLTYRTDRMHLQMSTVIVLFLLFADPLFQVCSTCLLIILESHLTSKPPV